MHIHTLKKFSYWEWNFPGATCIAGNKCTETVSANQLPKGTVLWPYFVGGGGNHLTNYSVKICIDWWWSIGNNPNPQSIPYVDGTQRFDILSHHPLQGWQCAQLNLANVWDCPTTIVTNHLLPN